MNNKIELVIFDMDGLIIDTESISVEAWNKVFTRLNIGVEKIFYSEIIGSSAKVIEKKMLQKKIVKNKAKFQEILSMQRAEATEIISSKGINKKEGIDELLDYLEKEGIKKAVASSSFRSKVDKFLTITGLRCKFDYIIAGDEVNNTKPAPDLYKNVIKQFHINNENTIILEDSKNGLESAKSAGITKRIYIPDIVILSPKEEKELSYKKFSNLLEVKNELQRNNNIL